MVMSHRGSSVAYLQTVGWVWEKRWGDSWHRTSRGAYRCGGGGEWPHSASRKRTLSHCSAVTLHSCIAWYISYDSVGRIQLLSMNTTPPDLGRSREHTRGPFAANRPAGPAGRAPANVERRPSAQCRGVGTEVSTPACCLATASTSSSVFPMPLSVAAAASGRRPPPRGGMGYLPGAGGGAPALWRRRCTAAWHPRGGEARGGGGVGNRRQLSSAPRRRLGRSRRHPHYRRSGLRCWWADWRALLAGWVPPVRCHFLLFHLWSWHPCRAPRRHQRQRQSPAVAVRIFRSRG